MESKTLQLSIEDKTNALDAALNSETFAKADQLRQFLGFVCRKEIAGQGESISEYLIGVEVFGRPEGYSILEDSTVRKRAYELRQKLVRLYGEELAGAPVRIEIPKGSYTPRFTPFSSQPGSPVDVAEMGGRGGRRQTQPITRAFALFGLLSIAGLIALYIYNASHPGDELDFFWLPATQSSSDVTICAGHPVVYRFTREALARSGVHDFSQVQTTPLMVEPDQVFHGRDIVTIPDQYIGLGSAEAIAMIHGWLARKGKNSSIEFGNDLTFVGLRKSPAVIIGAFNNKWMLEITKNLRLYFDSSEGVPRVKDRASGQSWGLPNLKENGATNEDYVLVSRLITSPSGQFLVAAAGLTQYGGHTVGEVLTQPQYLKQALRAASKDWRNRNLQLLFHVDVIRGAAGPPKLVLLHEW